MTSLAQAGDRLEPAEDFFYSFAPPLAEQVAGVASAASVDRAVDLLRNVRGDSILTQGAHQLLLIVTLVGAQRDSTLARDLCCHRQRRHRLGLAAGLSQASVDHQAVAIIHLHVPRIAEPGLFARPFAGQARFRIGGRLVSCVGAPLTMKVDARVAGIVGRGWLVVPFALETLMSGPGLDQRAVDRKMLVREQSLGARLLDYRVEKALCYLAHQQALPILREDRHVPDRIVDVEPHKPAKQEVVIELLHQQPLAAHRVQHLQQQRAQKLLRRNRRPPAAGVDRVEAPRRLLEGRIYHYSDGSQRMILWYSPLRRYVAEHSALLVVYPAHHRHLRLQPLPARLYTAERRTNRFSAAC